MLQTRGAGLPGRNKMTRRQKRTLVRILLSGTLLITAALLPLEGVWKLPAFLLPYAIIGWDILWKAARNIVHGQIFDENFLMCIATIGALVLSEYAEAVGVMLFYQVGELFQNYAVGKSRRSIAALMDIRPDTANLLVNGEPVETDPEDIAVGDHILVRPGEKIPLDGVILSGVSTLDTAALTGESAPRDVQPGDDILSGCVNLTGVLTVEVQKPFGESTVARILALVENAASKKAKSENFITRFARYYTPAVVVAALLLAVVPPLFGGLWRDWLHRALIFLVISCPCALVISIPLSFFGGIGGASARGILVKGGNYLELLAKTETVVFDKTGTLTRGVFRVAGVYPAAGCTEEQLLEAAAKTECHSSHPIAQSLRNAYGKPIDPALVTEVQELPGHGITARVNGVITAAGNDKLMASLGIDAPPTEGVGTVVHVAAKKQYLGCVVIADTVKPTAHAAIEALKKQGITTVMLTGDSDAVGKAVAAELGLNAVYTQLLPADKVHIAELLLASPNRKGALAYVGDGINDAPVLSRADVGIAMGALGSDAAIEAADVVLMDDDPAKILAAMAIAKKCLRIVKQNIVFALGIKGLFLLLGALGVATMWEAVFADVGVAVLAILNAMRMLKP